MKNSTLLTVILFFLVSLGLVPIESKAQRFNVNLSLFRNELGPHGRWMMHPRFGEVWSYSEPGFRPYYTNGYWDYGPDGWEWVSDYEWGWAPFHYGRWELDPYYGWLWIPGYEWAPAWVTWSEGSDYYGWAPMGYGINVNIRIGQIPGDRWIFCPRNRIHERSFGNYCAPYSHYRRILPTIAFINIFGGRDRNYWAGPDRREAEQYMGRPIERREYNERYDNRNRYNEAGQRRPYITRPYRGNSGSNERVRSYEQREGPLPSVATPPPARNNSTPPSPAPINNRRFDNRDVDYGNGQRQGQGRIETPTTERGQAIERPAPREAQKRETVERPRRGRD